jgi:hypothetical protein
MEWQSIDTYPKRFTNSGYCGPEVVVLMNGFTTNPIVARLISDVCIGRTVETETDMELMAEPSHWIPIPVAFALSLAQRRREFREKTMQLLTVRVCVPLYQKKSA